MANPSTQTEALYEKILAYYRGELSPADRAAVGKRVRRDAKARAHLESVRFLDLERAAALQDAEDLHQFADVTPFCQQVAARAAQVGSYFAEAAGQPKKAVKVAQAGGGATARTVAAVSQAPPSAEDTALMSGPAADADTVFERPPSAGAAAERGLSPEWQEHVEECVYCRRMWRRAHAEEQRRAAGLGEDEPLLRDWLLEPYYTAALERTTQRVARSPVGEAPGLLTDLLRKYRRDPEPFLRKMERVTPVLLGHVMHPAEPTREQEQAFRRHLRTPPVLDYLGKALHVRDALRSVVARFCEEHRLAEPEAVKEYLTRNVMDNILWQAAVAAEQAVTPNEAGLQAAADELRQQLRTRKPEAANETVRRALKRYPPAARPLELNLENQFAELVR